MFNVKYIMNEKGEKTDIILPFTFYQELLEEISDLKFIAERKDEELISHSEVLNLLEHERI